MSYDKYKTAQRKDQGSTPGEKRVARVYSKKNSRVKSALSFKTKTQKKGKLA